MKKKYRSNHPKGQELPDTGGQLPPTQGPPVTERRSPYRVKQDKQQEEPLTFQTGTLVVVEQPGTGTSILAIVTRKDRKGIRIEEYHPQTMEE